MLRPAAAAGEFAQALERRAEYDGEFHVVWPTDAVFTSQWFVTIRGSQCG